MTAVTAWPFLVARTSSAGHRVVLAPDFMVEGDTHELLSRVAAGPPTPPGELVHHALPDDISVLSRVVEPYGQTYGIDVAGPLRDHFGRRIRATEGLVFRGAAPPVVTSEDLAAVHGVIARAYRQAWLDDSTGVHAQTSTGTRLPHTGSRLRVNPSSTASDSPRTVQETTFTRQKYRIGRRTPVLLGGLILVASAFTIPRIFAGANSPAALTSVLPTTPAVTSAAQPPCHTVTASCLITGLAAAAPPQVVVEPQDDNADTTLTRDPQCWHDNRGLGLQLRWAAGVPGRWTLTWPTPARPVGKSPGIGKVILSVRQQNGAESLQLVIKGPEGGVETPVAVPLTGDAGTWQRAEVAIPAAGGSLPSIRSVALEWTTSEAGDTGLCVDDIDFR